MAALHKLARSRATLIALVLAVAVVATAAGLFGTGRNVQATHGAPHVTLEIGAARDITINGIDPDDLSGHGVAVGDVNGDGVADLIVGALSADPGGRTDAGETYVVFGPLLSSAVELSTDADVTINGIDPGDSAGIRMAVGDVNNDGTGDLIIGAHTADPGGRVDAGETYVLFGPIVANSTPLELSTEADIVINGVAPDDLSGISVAAGDINHDGAEDVIIGASAADPGGRTGAGTVYVLFGPLEATSTPLELSAADITFNGIDPFDRAGYKVAMGDVDNNGAEELIIGAITADPGGRTDAGETYVVFGPVGAGTYELSSAATVTINGIDPDDLSGLGAAVWDVNGDGAGDLVIGAPGADPGGRLQAGETYIVFGPLVSSTVELSTDADVTINGIDLGDNSGRDVAVGDLNADGVADLIIGAYFADPGGRLNAGETYVIFGEPPPPQCNGLTATIVGTDAGDMLVGTAGDDVIAGLGGSDVILGRGGNDTICAGPGADTVGAGDGDDFIAAGGGNDRVSGGLGDDIVYGHGGDDQLLGEGGDDVLFGNGGDDTIDCGDGSDIARGGRGTDTATASCELQGGVP